MLTQTLERPKLLTLNRTHSRVKGRPVINVDMDGVLYDFVGAFHDFARRFTGRDLPRPTTWHFHEEWDMLLEEWLRLFQKGVEYESIWGEGYVMPGASLGMQVLSDMDLHIRVVTSKMGFKGMNELIGTNTIRWLDANNIPYRSVSFLANGELKSDYRAELLIDDNLDNIRDFSRVGQVILFDQPYNQPETAADEQYARANTWFEVVELVEGSLR